MMKRLQIALSLAILTCAHASYAKTTQIEYIQDIAKQIDYAEKSNVWPGFHPATTPSIIQFTEEDKKSAYAIHFKPGNQQWWMLANSTTPIYFIKDTSVLNIKDNEKFSEVDGQRSFILDLDPKSFAVDTNFVNKYMLERFKSYLASESKIDPKNAQALQTSYDSFNDASLMKLVYLEDAALTLAQQDDTALAEDALRDAVAIHQYHNKLISASARQYENANEIAQGVPVYVSWSAKQLSDQDYRKMTQRTGCTPLNGMMGAKTMIDCSVNGFPAFVSSVFGHALDKKMTNTAWKNEVESQFKSISQTIIDLYHFSDTQAESMTKQAMTKPAYHYDRIEHIVDHTMQPYLDGMHAAVNDYNNKSGIEFRAPAVYGQAIMLLSMFQPIYSDSYQMDSNTALYKNVTIDLPMSEDQSAEHFILTNLPYVTSTMVQKNLAGETDEEASYTGFKLSDKAELIIDGKKILASDFVRAKKTQDFNTLMVIDENLQLPFPERAQLDASNGYLIIKAPSDSQQLMRLVKRAQVAK